MTDYTELDTQLRRWLDEDKMWAHEASLLDEDAGYAERGVHWQWTDAYGTVLQFDALTMHYLDEAVVRQSRTGNDLLLESIETYDSRSVGEMSQLAIKGAYEVAIPVGVHIQRHDPAAALADIAGKVALLDHVASWQHTYLDGDTWFSCSQAEAPRVSEEFEGPGSGCADEKRAGKPCDCGLDGRRIAVLRCVAAGYVERPEFKAEWRINA